MLPAWAGSIGVYAPGPVVLPRLTEARHRHVEARGLAAHALQGMGDEP
ncbi:MAG: hypothetical protein ACK6CU_05440 [Deltaproteobacteria bacterium]|jgi:hypothetical protein